MTDYSRLAETSRGVLLVFYVAVCFRLLDSFCLNCWWGRFCVFSPCGVVLVHLDGAGAPLVTRATPEGTTCERVHTHTDTRAHTADRAAVIRISINHEEWSGQPIEGRGASRRARFSQILINDLYFCLVQITVSQVCVYGIWAPSLFEQFSHNSTWMYLQRRIVWSFYRKARACC